MHAKKHRNLFTKNRYVLYFNPSRTTSKSQQNVAKRQRSTGRGPTIKPAKGVYGRERSTPRIVKLESKGTAVVDSTRKEVLGASSVTTHLPVQRPYGFFFQPTKSTRHYVKATDDPLTGQTTVARGAVEASSLPDRGDFTESCENAGEAVLVRQLSPATPCNTKLKENNVKDDEGSDVEGGPVVLPSSTESLQKVRSGERFAQTSRM